MQSETTVDEVIALARRLSPMDQSKLIEQLRPDLSPNPGTNAVEERVLEELYVRGYEKFPEDVADVTALLPHLPLATETWE